MDYAYLRSYAGGSGTTRFSGIVDDDDSSCVKVATVTDL